MCEKKITVGTAVKQVLCNIGIYADSEKTAFEKAVFERYISNDVSIDAVATKGIVKQLIYNVYDILEEVAQDDTPLCDKCIDEFIREVSNEAIHKVFKDPTNRFRVHPMEHELSEDNSNTDKFLMDTGAGGAVINAPWKDGWNQNAENLEKLKSTAEMLKERKLHSWLYDEQVYPSGWAAGYVDTPDDRYVAKNIGISIVMGTGTSEMRVGLPENGYWFINGFIYDYSGFEIHFDSAEALEVTEKQVSFTGREGLWIALCFFVRNANIWPYKWAKEISAPIGPRKLLNFLDKEAVDKFLEGSIEAVADKLGFLGDYFEAVFTDEPSLQALYDVGERHRPAFESVPYGKELFEFFENKYGYDLRQKLPYLFFGQSDEAKRTRVHYWSVIGDMLVKNFTGNYRERCNKHGLHFSGHLIAEETLYAQICNYGNYMQVVGEMDYPGFDMLSAWNPFFWERGTSFSNGCLYAASQTKLNGHNTTMVEICPVSGQGDFLKDPFLNFEKLMTSSVFCGATYVNTYGYRFMNDNNIFNALNEYMGRVCLFAAMGINDAKIAVYYPAEDIQANMIEQTEEMYDISDPVKALNAYVESLYHYLFTNLIDFNIVSADGLSKAVIENAKLNILNMSYNAVIVPPVEVMSFEALKTLKGFADKGGRVFFLERVPSLAVENVTAEELKAVTDSFTPVVLGLDNVLFRAKVTASHVCEKYSTEPVTNGSAATFTCFDGWSSDQLPATLDIKLDGKRTFNHLELYSTEEHEQSGFKAQYHDGNEWVELCEVKDNTYCRMNGDFEDITTDNLRIVFEKGCKTDEKIARLNEIQGYRIYKSDKPNEFTKALRGLCENSVTVSNAEANSLRMRRLKMNGENCYFVVNTVDRDQTLEFASLKDVEIRLYDPMTGEITRGSSISYTVREGRAVFVLESR